MFLEWTPDDGQPAQRWYYRPGRIPSPEQQLIERLTDWRWKQFLGEIEMGSSKALQVLLWSFRRRTHLELRLEDVVFCDDELALIKDQDELAADIVDLENAAGDMPEDERQKALAYIRFTLRSAPPAPGKAPAAATPAEPVSAPAPATAAEPTPQMSTPPAMAAASPAPQPGPDPSTT